MICYIVALCTSVGVPCIRIIVHTICQHYIMYNIYVCTQSIV